METDWKRIDVVVLSREDWERVQGALDGACRSFDPGSTDGQLMRKAYEIMSRAGRAQIRVPEEECSRCAD